jgi:hypothetical protein
MSSADATRSTVAGPLRSEMRKSGLSPPLTLDGGSSTPSSTDSPSARSVLPASQVPRGADAESAAPSPGIVLPRPPRLCSPVCRLPAGPYPAMPRSGQPPRPAAGSVRSEPACYWQYRSRCGRSADPPARCRGGATDRQPPAINPDDTQAQSGGNALLRQTSGERRHAIVHHRRRPQPVEQGVPDEEPSPRETVLYSGRDRRSRHRT